MIETCCVCGDVLSGESRELPVVTNDDDGSGEGKRETFCPQCFKWVRAPLSPERWHWLAMVAFKCRGCGVTSLSFSGPHCGQCGSQSGLALPCKQGAGHASLSELSHAVTSRYEKG